MLNLRAKIVAAGLTLITLAALAIVYAPTPAAQRPESISISSGSDHIVKDGSATFKAKASDLFGWRSYEIRLAVSGGISSSACSATSSSLPSESVAQGRQSYTRTFTLYGCSTPGGTVTAELWDVTPDEEDPEFEYLLATSPQKDVAVGNRPTVTIETTDQTVNGRDSVTLDATASDADGDSLTYSWSGSGTFEGSSDLDTTWTAPAAKISNHTYRLTITVSDGFLTASTSVSITVRGNRAPIVMIETSGGTVNGGDSVTLDATASDPDGDSLTYSWSGSGTFANSSALDTTWTAPAAKSTAQQYTLTITVSDGSLTASDTVTFTVPPIPPPPPPPPPLTAPANLDIIPLPLRRVSLSWTGNPNASGYAVEACDPDTDPNDCAPTSTGWTSLVGNPGCEVITGQPLPACRMEINLDSIIHGRGLADTDVYRLRVKATTTGGRSSPYSDEIIIRDNPLLTSGGRAYGSSSSQATLKWRTESGATNYSIRYRQLGSYTASTTFGIKQRDHTHLDWPRGGGWPYYDNEDQRQSETSDTPGNETIGSLDEDELYAFQINYEVGNTKVFSARDAFVWPSGDFPGNGKRVGTYTFFGHWEGGRYDYTVCSSTFVNPSNDDPPSDGPSGNDSSRTGDEATEWTNLINHAFKQWQRAVPDRLTVTRVTESPCESDRGPIDNNVPITVVRALHNGYNEVYMVDMENWGRPVGIINENNTLFHCIRHAPACVISTHYWDLRRSPGRPLDDGSVDVLVKASRQGRDKDIPGNNTIADGEDIRFNTCRIGTSGGDQDGDDDFSNYELMVHEAGHALGLSNISLSRLLFQRYEDAHPTIPDSVMNYDDEVPAYWATWASSPLNEPDCSPHPFDIMAAYALYQAVDPSERGGSSD